MGAGASAIPVGKYSAELQKPKDGSDLYETGDYEFAKSEAERLLRELGKYVEDPAVVGLDSSLKSITSRRTKTKIFVRASIPYRTFDACSTNHWCRQPCTAETTTSNAGKNLLFKALPWSTTIVKTRKIWMNA